MLVLHRAAIGMGRRVSVLSCIEKRTKNAFRLSHFALDSSHFHSNSSVLNPCNDVNCCNNGNRPANRGRGEGRACGRQMCLCCGSSFPMSGTHNHRPHHYFRSAVVQAEHFLSTTAAQNCKNVRPEEMCIWSLRPEFWVPNRNWGSRPRSLDIKSVPEKSESEEEEDDFDQSLEKNEAKNLVMYEHSDRAVVDLMEVERVYKVVEELFASDRNMEAVLDQCDVKLSHSLVYHVLIRFSHARKPAFRFFNWAGQQVGFSHNSLTCNTMMSILARTKQFVTMLELLKEMGKMGSVLTIETFEIAIKAFAAAREMKKAVQMFDLMERYDFDANLNAFNFLLDALGRVKLAKEAQMLFERMRGRFPPNVRTYTVLISGWCEAKNLIEAGKLWNEMVDEGFKPDLVTHNIMLGGLFKGRKKDEALKLFGLMKINGPCPDSKSYTIVIRALSKLQKMEEASKFFAEMQEHGSPLDAAVYTCMITGYGNTKKLDKAYVLLQEMKEKGIPHDCRTYNALIKVMMVLHKPDEATKLFEKMSQCGFQPTIHTYNMLMKLYFRARNPEMGFAIWDQMARNGCCPDVNSYTVFIGGLIREGRSEEACAYIESMIDKGMKAPRFDYNKFLADFSRAGRPDIFEELAAKMKHAGKLDISDVFLRRSQKMKTRVKIRRVLSK